MTKNLYLHVGPYKTGTTSLQETLYANREEFLRRTGIAYLDDKKNHGPILRNMFSKNPVRYNNNKRRGLTRKDIEQQVAEYERNLREKLESFQEDLLISGEHLSDLSQEELIDLKAFFDSYFDDIFIIYYVRDPNDLIGSDLQETVKNGRDISLFTFKYIALRYKQKIEYLENVFGENNVRVLVFEAGLKNERGFTNYFLLNGLGVDFEINKRKEVRANESISLSAFRLLVAYNSLYPEHINGVKNINRNNKLFNIIKSIPGKKGDFKLKLNDDDLEMLNKNLQWLSKRNIASYVYINGEDSISKEISFDVLKEMIDHLNDVV